LKSEEDVLAARKANDEAYKDEREGNHASKRAAFTCSAISTNTKRCGGMIYPHSMLTYAENAKYPINH
jgi:hypothetical protein